MPNLLPHAFGTYPGEMGKFFGPAAWQYAQDIRGAAQGGPYAAAASDDAAGDYYARPNNMPSFSDMITGVGDLGRLTTLGRGLAGANVSGTQATNKGRNVGIQGTLSNNNAFAQSKYNDIASQMGLQFAKNQATDQNIGIFGQLAKPFFGAGGMLTGGPGSPGAIPQIIGGSVGMPNINIFSKLLGPGGIMGLFSGGGAGLSAGDAVGLGDAAAGTSGLGDFFSSMLAAAPDLAFAA
jgi:hypothetical protein